MLGANQLLMRERNERLVLSLVRKHGPLSKSEIARMTGLSAQAGSVIMRGLEHEGLLEKQAPVRGKVGQPLVPMNLAADGAFFLGLKVGRRRTELMLIDFRGSVLGSEVQRHDYPTPDATVAFARSATASLLTRLDASQRKRIAGFGIGLPFQLWNWAGALQVPQYAMADWRHRDIRAELAEEMAWPVVLENDATAACNAELVFGTSDLPRNFLYAFLGFFIGGGLVLNGTLFTGSFGNAGALASMLVPDGTGKVRQLVSVASLSELERQLETGSARLWESADTWDVDEAVLDAWMDQAAAGLAHAAVAAVAVCDLEALVIDGWLPEPLRQRLVAKTEIAFTGLDLAGIRCPQVLSGTVGPMARVLGAASLPLSMRFLVDLGA